MAHKEHDTPMSQLEVVAAFIEVAEEQCINGMLATGTPATGAIMMLIIGLRMGHDDPTLAGCLAEWMSQNIIPGGRERLAEFVSDALHHVGQVAVK